MRAQKWRTGRWRSGNIAVVSTDSRTVGIRLRSRLLIWPSPVPRSHFTLPNRSTLCNFVCVHYYSIPELDSISRLIYTTQVLMEYQQVPRDQPEYHASWWSVRQTAIAFPAPHTVMQSSVQPEPMAQNNDYGMCITNLLCSGLASTPIG